MAGVPVIRDDPIVSYRETIVEKSNEQCLAKSPNKHNRLFMVAEPIHDDLIKLIEDEKLYPSQDVKARARVLINDFQWEEEHARKIWSFGPDGKGPNLFIDCTKAIQ